MGVIATTWGAAAEQVVSGIVGTHFERAKTALDVQVMFIDLVGRGERFKLNTCTDGETVVGFDRRREMDFAIGTNRGALVTVVEARHNEGGLGITTDLELPKVYNKRLLVVLRYVNRYVVIQEN